MPKQAGAKADGATNVIERNFYYMSLYEYMEFIVMNCCFKASAH